jgi:hypothetical protein
MKDANGSFSYDEKDEKLGKIFYLCLLLSGLLIFTSTLCMTKRIMYFYSAGKIISQYMCLEKAEQ